MEKCVVIVLDYGNGGVVILENVEFTETSNTEDLVLKALEKIGYKVNSSEIAYMVSDYDIEFDYYNLDME